MARLINADDFISRVESGEFVYLQADKQDVIDAVNCMSVIRTDKPLCIINEQCIYITQGHIDAMIEYEKKQMIKLFVDRFNENLTAES